MKTLAVGAGLAALPQRAAMAGGARTGRAKATAAGPECAIYCSPTQGCYGCPSGWSMFECRSVCGDVWCECFARSCSGFCYASNYC